ncbi:MAG: ArsA family ATPase [Acidimicrobiales bacterium]|nr:ArsA family ATPase [Acidimicrobiales bacterium]
MAATVADVVGESRVVVCTGSGGVGKTTVSAALALQAARTGRRAAVITIDPARRLADALGLGSLTNEPTRIAGDWDGELWAMMLDTKQTFDELITTYAAEPAQAERILDNRYYRNLSEALSGTREFMAMEKLYELTNDARFDLVVVDTPPTRNAIDFVDAPDLLTRFLRGRLFRMVVGSRMAKAVNATLQLFLRQIARVVSPEVVEDTITFLQAFEGMEEGFRDRADRVAELLADPRTSFVLVAAPRPEVVQEALDFTELLAERGLEVRSLVINRVHPSFGTDVDLVALNNERPRLAGTHAAPSLAAFDHLTRIAAAEAAQLDPLSAAVGDVPEVRIPLLDDDVHDLGGIDRVRAFLG